MRYRILLLILIATLGLPSLACLRAKTTPTAQPIDTSMGVSVQPGNLTPPVKGFYKGGMVVFIHTEASDPQVASMLTRMMGPEVMLVPSLARIPESLLANVYVFNSGVKGEGPFGYQADVFDSVPGDPEYSPLRAVNLVTWKKVATAIELRSVEEIRAAEAKGDLTVTRSKAVVNMPLLTWPGGNR